MKINKTTTKDVEYVKNRTGPKPDNKKPKMSKKTKTR